MPMTQANFAKIVNERVMSLVGDGYLIRTISENASRTFYKLLHRSNGNVVTITAFWQARRLVQRSNGIIVHQQDY